MPDVRYALQNLADALSPNTGTSDGFVDNVETSLARISQALPEILGGKIEAESLAAEYDDQATYDIGDYCTHNGVLYICATAVTTAESWDSAKWVAIPLIEKLKEKLDAPADGAVAGRYLMVGQNGEPVWNQLDESDIRQSVYDWMSAHPEAIVVNDGTITRAKLDNSVGQAVDEVSELKADFQQLSAVLPITADGWEQGTVYGSNVADWRMIFQESAIRCRLANSNLTPQYSRITANDGYQITCYFCTKSGDYYYQAYDTPGWHTSIDVSDYVSEYYVFVACRKVGDANIVPAEAKANINFYTPLTDKVDGVSELDSRVGTLEEDVKELNKTALFSEVAPTTITNGYAWYDTNKSTIPVGNATLKKYNISPDTDYYASTAFTGASAGFPLIAYFDSTNTFISYEYMNVANATTAIDCEKLNIPNNASWFYVNCRNSTSAVYIKEIPSMTISEIIDAIGTAKKAEISILFVGNSLTQDGIAYLPYLLKSYFPEISFRFYMYYNGGYTLAQQYEQFVADEACNIFSVAENVESWTNSSAKMSAVLSTYTFDIVCLQEYFNYKKSYTASDLADWNNCRDYIQDNYTGGNGLEFISLFHAPLRSSAEAVFDLTKTGNALILKDTISEDMIPMGIAVYNALSTDLDSLGDNGHLSPDGTHTQEGLPCLLQTYVAILWVLDKLAINKSVYGLPFKMTTAIYNTINVPGPNLGTGVIEGTDAQNLLAQEVAIMAYKEGKKFVNNSI